MKVLNLTPHAIKLNDGTVFLPSGHVARVRVGFDPDICISIRGNNTPVTVFTQEFGGIEGLPDPEIGTVYLVSAIVLQAAKAKNRLDCAAPASGHPDVIRDEKGQILSVPGLVR